MNMVQLKQRKVALIIHMHTMTKKGFTLIELLVVIAIVAVLSVVVILTLNPAELLRQARDANRVSDMSTLKSAISLYLADVSSPSLGSVTLCYESTAAASSTAGCGGLFSATRTATSSDSRAVDGSGWIPVNFNGISSGAPVGNLPVDPVNNASYFYAYAASSTTFEVDTKMESTRYVNGGSGDVESKDGGDKANYYEIGNAPGLAL
ncbi:MAG: hypothetical protein A2946_01310 [Candidatus Liptonbacteria bacterium RIFCSPLOWO2_01_FULL_53_13]|uniref:Type II secretion system protein GspG C-terminal domain-containing protein n=1 Tax=Candidatus Liptonbacteria bacterium RIFCSPLOWO2_01_FULL_53_13 TaxID=1798651 RepID=A0A1G2CLT3_9BACT|nr:MAG: hypothetical protein A2946_01310 [Candidatus Liptonbacteria bacterium RIFCSPLOWO2_01_FULL_53_13]